MAFNLGSVLGGVAGALGGAAGSGSSQSFTSGIRLRPASELELGAGSEIQRRFGELGGFTDMGPGQQDIQAGLGSQRGLAEMLEQFSQGGFLPGQQDFATAQQFTQDAFAPERVGMQQQQQADAQRTARLAAQLGRPVNDPILQAKLAQSNLQAQERLGARETAFRSEFAQSLPQQRLGYAAQGADVRGALANQAFANRQALLGLGSQIQGQERDFRIATGERFGTQSTQSGGGFAQGLMGAIAGMGGGSEAGARLGLPSLSSMFGGGSTPDMGQAGLQGASFGGAGLMGGAGALQQAFRTPSSAGVAGRTARPAAQTFSTLPAHDRMVR